MAIARVTNNSWQSSNRQISGGGTFYVQQALTDAVQAGSLLVAISQVIGDRTATFSDSAGNTWVKGIESAYNSALGGRWAIGYALNAAAGATTPRVTYSDDAFNRSIAVAEFTGVATSSAVDGTAVTASASSSSQPDPGAITSTGDALFIGFANVSSDANPTEQTSYTAYHPWPSSGDYKMHIEDWIATGVQTNHHPKWLSSHGFWTAMGIAFKAAAGSSTPIAAITANYRMMQANQ